MEFPRLVYKSAAVHMGVENALEHMKALADGWFASVPEALAGKHTPVVDTTITVYKEQAGKMESFKASNQEEADLFVKGDGWYESPAAATAAVIKAEWPADKDAVDALMGDLERKKKPEVFAYAARIGVTVGNEMRPADVLAAVRARLEAGA